MKSIDFDAVADLYDVYVQTVMNIEAIVGMGIRSSTFREIISLLRNYLAGKYG